MESRIDERHKGHVGRGTIGTMQEFTVPSEFVLDDEG